MARGEGVKQLKDLFARYKERLVAPEGSVLDAAVEVVGDVLRIEVSRADFKYNPRNKTLTVSGGILRQEVLFHKEEILLHLKGRLGPQAAPTTIL